MRVDFMAEGSLTFFLASLYGLNQIYIWNFVYDSLPLSKWLKPLILIVISASRFNLFINIIYISALFYFSMNYWAAIPSVHSYYQATGNLKLYCTFVSFLLQRPTCNVSTTEMGFWKLLSFRGIFFITAHLLFKRQMTLWVRMDFLENHSILEYLYTGFYNQFYQ